jgi:hypothetical protein
MGQTKPPACVYWVLVYNCGTVLNCGRGHRIIIALAPCVVGVVPVAWDEYKSMSALSVLDCRRATGRQPDTGNLSAIVDRPRIYKLEVRVPRNQRVQVDHRTVFPQKRVYDAAIAGERLTHDLTSRINVMRPTAGVTIHSSEIRGNAIPPEIRMKELIGKKSLAHNLSRIVEGVSQHWTSADRVCEQINKLFSVPQKWVKGLVSCQG